MEVIKPEDYETYRANYVLSEMRRVIVIINTRIQTAMTRVSSRPSRYLVELENSVFDWSAPHILSKVNTQMEKSGWIIEESSVLKLNPSDLTETEHAHKFSLAVKVNSSPYR